MENRTLGPLTVSALGLGCMGMSEFYGTGDERESDRHHPRRPRRRRAPCWTPPTCTARSRTSSSSAAPSPAAATRSSLATKFGNERGEDGSWVGHQRPARLRPSRLRRQPAAARRRPHRPLLPAPGGQDRADRGHRGAHGRAGRGREGPPPGPLRGGAGHHPPGARRASDHRTADRVLALGRATRRTKVFPVAAPSWASASSPYSPLGRGFLTGQSAAPTTSPRTTSAGTPPLPGRQLHAEPASSWTGCKELADREGLHRRPARPRLAARPGRATSSPIPGTKRRERPGGEPGRGRRRAFRGGPCRASTNWPRPEPPRGRATPHGHASTPEIRPRCVRQEHRYHPR